jgi:hypothetical protein
MENREKLETSPVRADYWVWKDNEGKMVDSDGFVINGTQKADESFQDFLIRIATPKDW